MQPTETNNHQLVYTLEGTSMIDTWGEPERIEVYEDGESIVMIYKQTSNFSPAIWPAQPRQARVFKIVYSCIDGKWNKSEPIYGKIIPMQSESYEFEE